MLPSQFKRYTDDSEPLVVDPEVATKIGLNESIIIRQLHYWLQFNEKADKKSNKKTHQHLDDIYCWNTIEEWKEQFPFWSVSTIKRAFAELRKLDLICVISNPKNSWDKTNWYTINYAKYASLFDSTDELNMNQSSGSDCTDPSGQNELIYNVSETTPEINNREEGPSQKLPKLEIKVKEDFLTVADLQNGLDLVSAALEDMMIMKQLQSLYQFLQVKDLKLSEFQEIVGNKNDYRDFSVVNALQKKFWGGWVDQFRSNKAIKKLKELEDPNRGKIKITHSDFIAQYYALDEAEQLQFETKYYF